MNRDYLICQELKCSLMSSKNSLNELVYAILKAALLHLFHSIIIKNFKEEYQLRPEAKLGLL